MELSNPLSYDEAFLFVTQGQDIWVRDQDLAYNIAFYAAGGQAHIKPRKPQKCIPMPGYDEKGCIEGTAAFHYHVSGKRYDDVHIFFGDQAIFFY